MLIVMSQVIRWQNIFLQQFLQLK
uniref:Uncharacterized protein n=1 Tax=Ciona intestinalis TaxID=7719 RepID=H2XVF0_CIOIN